MSVFQHDISKTDVARIAKRDTEMFNDEFWKAFILGLKVEFMRHENIAGVGLCTLVSAGFFELFGVVVECWSGNTFC